MHMSLFIEAVLGSWMVKSSSALPGREAEILVELLVEILVEYWWNIVGILAELMVKVWM